MARHVLFAYVEGSDIDDDADLLVEAFERFVARAPWPDAVPTVVDQVRRDDPSLGPGDRPDRDLGLNLELPDPDAEGLAWYEGVERVAIHLGELVRATGHTFVIGLGDIETGISEDVFFVDSDTPDLEQLRRCFLG
jgi:hypothetical protein